MSSIPIPIGGATGATGNVATKLLLKKGFPIRAYVHKDDERAHKGGLSTYRLHLGL